MFSCMCIFIEKGNAGQFIRTLSDFWQEMEIVWVMKSFARNRGCRR